MATAYSKYLEVFSAKQFKESVSEPSSSNVYLSFGRCVKWTNDSTPFGANTSVGSFNDVWFNMIGAKKVSGNDIRHAIPRFDWTSGTVYTAYDHTIDSRALKNDTTKFYVVTDEWNVYKCLSNNYGAISTSKPSATITDSDFQTQDGYIWKFMYSISEEEKLRFVTKNFIPVKTLETPDNTLQWQTQNNAIQGAIHAINIVDGGYGWNANTATVNIAGDGAFANAYAVRNVVSNTISSIIVDIKGEGFTYANVSVRSSTANGKGVIAKAVIAPQGGHGSDPLTELGGSYLIINTRIDGTEGGILSVANDYRQVALIEDPLVYQTDRIAGNSAISQLTVLTLSPPTGSAVQYLQDEEVYQGASLQNSDFRGVVVEWDSSNNLLKLSNTRGTPTALPVIGKTSTAARYLANYEYPELQPGSGKLLYIDNVTPIKRSEDQTEDYKIVLSF